MLGHKLQPAASHRARRALLHAWGAGAAAAHIVASAGKLCRNTAGNCMLLLEALSEAPEHCDALRHAGAAETVVSAAARDGDVEQSLSCECWILGRLCSVTPGVACSPFSDGTA